MVQQDSPGPGPGVQPAERGGGIVRRPQKPRAVDSNRLAGCQRFAEQADLAESLRPRLTEGQRGVPIARVYHHQGGGHGQSEDVGGQDRTPLRDHQLHGLPGLPEIVHGI